MHPFRIIPEYREYVWGGKRLRPHHPTQTAEAWVIYENNRIAEGPLAGQTLAQAAFALGEDLLGSRGIARTGDRFPLLIKLLDCAEWLSLQVHPNDQQARHLVGEGHFGKTEAWHILDVDDDASLIAGVKDGVSADSLAQAIIAGCVIDLVQYHSVQKGDTLLMLPGTLHALGPGLLLYEVQQTSDITYRVYDWDRPQTAERCLHIAEALQVADVRRTSRPMPLPVAPDGTHTLLCQSDYFRLFFLTAGQNTVQLDTDGESFHALTAIEGMGLMRTAGGALFPLQPYETILVPAASGAYNIEGRGNGLKILLAMI